MEPLEIKLVLKWRQTWEGKEQDFVASLPNVEGSIGRIYLYETGPQQGHWFWSFTAVAPNVSRNIGATSGVEPSPREAAKRVEDAWHAAIKGTEYENQESQSETANAYAAAQGR